MRDPAIVSDECVALLEHGCQLRQWQITCHEDRTALPPCGERFQLRAVSFAAYQQQGWRCAALQELFAEGAPVFERPVLLRAPTPGMERNDRRGVPLEELARKFSILTTGEDGCR